MKFKFKGKSLFVMLGVLFIVPFFFMAPLGMLLLLVGLRDMYVSIDDQYVILRMFRKKTIPVHAITDIVVKKVKRSYSRVGYTTYNVATVVPLVITYGNNKLTLSLNYFENPNEILRLLEEKTGKKVELPEVPSA